MRSKEEIRKDIQELQKLAREVSEREFHKIMEEIDELYEELFEQP